MKKVENFMKREEEIARHKEFMSPEDSEYFECQQELQQDLLKSYNFVERIIGEYSDGSLAFPIHSLRMS